MLADTPDLVASPADRCVLPHLRPAQLSLLSCRSPSLCETLRKTSDSYYRGWRASVSQCLLRATPCTLPGAQTSAPSRRATLWLAPGTVVRFDANGVSLPPSGEYSGHATAPTQYPRDRSLSSGGLDTSCVGRTGATVG